MHRFYMVDDYKYKKFLSKKTKLIKLKDVRS